MVEKADPVLMSARRVQIQARRILVPPSCGISPLSGHQPLNIAPIASATALFSQSFPP
jgi:hypothetical protein